MKPARVEVPEDCPCQLLAAIGDQLNQAVEFQVFLAQTLVNHGLLIGKEREAMPPIPPLIVPTSRRWPSKP